MLTRRQFLWGSAAFPILGCGSHETTERASMLALVGADRGTLEASLWAAVETQRYVDQRETALRTLGALGEIFRQTTSGPVTPDQRAATERSIRDLIERSAHIDRKVFDGLARIAAGRDPALGERMRKEAHYSALGLQTLGVGLGVTHPGTALVLGIAGIWAEDGLVAFGNKLGQLPRTEPDRLGLMQRAVLTAIHETQSDFEAFRELAASRGIKEALGTSFDRPPAELCQALPPELRTQIEAVLRGDVAADARKLVEQLGASLDRQFTALGAQQATVVAQLQAQAEQRRREAIREQARQQLEYTRQELQGAVDVVGFVLGTVLGKPETARIARTVGTAAVQVFHAIESYQLGTIGAFAMLGGVAGGVSMIASLSGSKDDGLRQMSDHLRRIEEKIDALREHLDRRLDRIELTQGEILSQLATLTRQVREGNAIAQAHFRAISSDLAALDQRILHGERQNASQQFELAASRARMLLAAPRGPAFELGYVEQLSLFHEHAKTVARRSEHNGILPSPSSGPEGVRQRARHLLGLRRADLLVGQLPGVLAKHGSPIAVANPPNPIEWARGAQAFLELRVSASEVQLGNTGTLLEELWADGTALRALCIEASRARHVLRTVSELDHAHTALVTAVEDLVDKWCTENLDSFQTETFASWARAPRARRTYWLRAFSHDHQLVTFAADPIDVAVALGLATLTRVVGTRRSNLGDLTHTLTFTAVHPALAARVGRSAMQFEEVETPSGQLQCQFYNEDVVGPLLTACVLTIREEVHFDKLRSELPAWLLQQLGQEGAVLDRYDEAAADAALVAVIAALCASRAAHSIDDWSLDAVPVRLTRQRVGRTVAAHVDGDWDVYARDVDGKILWRERSTPQLAWLLGKLAPDTRAALEDAVGPDLEAALKQRVVRELNDVVHGPPLTSEARQLSSPPAELVRAAKLALSVDRPALNRWVLSVQSAGAVTPPARRALERTLDKLIAMDLKALTVPCPWWPGIASALREVHGRTHDALYEIARRGDGLKPVAQGTMVIDETLRRLGAFAALHGVELSDPVVAPGWDDVAEVRSKLGELLEAASAGFAGIGGARLAGAGPRRWRSKVELPGAASCELVAGADGATPSYAVCRFQTEQPDRGATWFDDLSREVTAVMTGHRMEPITYAADVLGRELRGAPSEPWLTLGANDQRVLLVIAAPGASRYIEPTEREMDAAVAKIVVAGRRRFRAWMWRNVPSHLDPTKAVLIPGSIRTRIIGDGRSAPPKPEYACQFEHWRDDAESVAMKRSRHAQLSTLITASLGAGWVALATQDTSEWRETATGMRIALILRQHVISFELTAPP